MATGILYILIVSNFQSHNDQAVTDEQEMDELGIDETVKTAQAEPEFKNEMLPISNGKRAMTIQVSDHAGVAGFLKPGKYVDIVSRHDAISETGERLQTEAATLVLQNIKLLAIGHAADTEEDIKRYYLATLELTPEEAVTLTFVSNTELYLLLRNDGDSQTVTKNLHQQQLAIPEGAIIR